MENAKIELLKKEQIQALKTWDISKINEINIKIFELREQEKARKHAQFEKERENRLSMRIYAFCEKEIENEK